MLDKDGGVGVNRQNTILAHESANVPLRLLGKANQAMSIQLMQETNDPDLKVLKVTILSITVLGEMTEADFYKGVEHGPPVIN